jgi:tRNA threonylcarbamoyladenosine biosynthesis protein TsaE
VVTTRKSKQASEPVVGATPRTSPSGPRTAFSLSEEETYEMGRVMGRSLRGGELILLDGDLGLGKTVFARGVAAGLGVKPEDVSSPSFTLVQEYTGGRQPMFHVDLYRLDDPNEIGTLGLEEILSSGGVILVEWGEKLPPYLRREAIAVRFHDVGEGSRKIEIQTIGKPAARPQGDA